LDKKLSANDHKQVGRVLVKRGGGRGGGSGGAV